MMRSPGLALLLGLLLQCLVACAPSPTNMPYEAWRLGFIAPYNMEAWVEDFRVEDVTGREFAGYPTGGLASTGHPEDSAAWPDRIGLGMNLSVRGAKLPKRIYVRWQSLVEPQTYSVMLEIPERARRLMLEPPARDMPGASPDGDKYYYNNLSIGLAPGGIVRVWVNGAVRRPQPVLCVKAQVEPKGPSQGLTHGAYAYTFKQLDSRTQAYLKSNRLPMGSWGC